MPEKTIELDCCVLFLSEYPKNFFSLELGDNRAAYIRIYNAALGLNSLEYFSLKNPEGRVDYFNVEQLEEFDRLIGDSDPSSLRILSKDELYNIYRIIGHMHIPDAMDHSYPALIQSRQKGERLSAYDEIIAQKNERRMLERTVNVSMQFSRSLSMRTILIDLAVKCENHQLLFELLFSWDANVEYEDAIRLLHKAVSSCITNNKFNMLHTIVKNMLELFQQDKSNYDDVSTILEGCVMQVPCERIAFHRVKRIFSLLGQLDKDVFESKASLGELRFLQVREFYLTIDQLLVEFMVNLFKPNRIDFCPVVSLEEQCMRELDNLERAVPSVAYSNLPADRDAYGELRQFLESLKSPKLPSMDSVYSFFDTSRAGSASRSDRCSPVCP